MVREVRFVPLSYISASPINGIGRGGEFVFSDFID